MKEKKSLCPCTEVPVSGTASEMCVGRVWLFESLEPPELQALIGAAVRKVHAPGHAIFVQADPTDRMFLIKAGRVRLSKLLEDGTEFTLDIRKAGDFLGENMLGEEAVYPVTAWCMEETLWFFDLVQVPLETRKIDLSILRELLSGLLGETPAA